MSLTKREYNKRFHAALAELLAVTELSALDDYARYAETHCLAYSPEYLAVSFFRNAVDSRLRIELKEATSFRQIGEVASVVVNNLARDRGAA